MEAQLPAVLQTALSPDQAQRARAMEWLEQAKASNLSEFLVVLASFMRNPQAPAESRQQAGLQLKNCLSSKDDRQLDHLQVRWRGIDAQQRQHVKQSALATLGTETTNRSTAAQVIAAIAEAEVPFDMWPDVISTLLHRLSPGELDSAKVASLECIGYICEVVDPDHLTRNANEILTAVVHHMREEEPNVLVKRAAIAALVNSLEFTKENFKNANERNTIMGCVCQATLSNDAEVKVLSLECLVKTMDLYYEYMEGYVNALYQISLSAIKSDASDDVGEKIVLQGIEFWNTVCERELDILDEIDQHGGGEQGAVQAATAGIPVYKQYAKGAHLELIPILLNLMISTCETEDEDDPDMWNPSKAAQLSLELYSNVCRDKVMPLVMHFVESNLRSPSWQHRDAALMAFASLLKHDPPVSDAEKQPLIQVVITAVPHLVEFAKDPSVVVRDSLAYLIGQILKETPSSIVGKPGEPMPKEYLHAICNSLHAGLNDQPRVAIQACWSIFNLASACHEIEAPDDRAATSQLTEYLPEIIKSLFSAASATNDTNLRLATFEALYGMIQYSPKDCYPTVLASTTEVLQRLEASLSQVAAARSSEALEAIAEMQSSYLSLLGACIDVLTQDHVQSIADRVMKILLALLGDTPTGKTSAVKEDAMLTITKFIDSIQGGIDKYLPWIKPHLMKGLETTAEAQVCLACVGVVGDLSRALSEKLLPHCDEIMNGLLKAIADANLQRDVKPTILGTFSDVAFAIGEQFSKYYQVTIGTLQAAAQTTMLNTAELDFDEIDHFNALREGCLDGYTGIFHALKGAGTAPSATVNVFQSQVDFLVRFIGTIFQDVELSDGCKRLSLGLLADLCSVFGNQMSPVLPIDFTNQILDEGLKSDQDVTRNLAEFARQQFHAIRM